MKRRTRRERKQMSSSSSSPSSLQVKTIAHDKPTKAESSSAFSPHTCFFLSLSLSISPYPFLPMTGVQMWTRAMGLSVCVWCVRVVMTEAMCSMLSLCLCVWVLEKESELKDKPVAFVMNVTFREQAVYQKDRVYNNHDRWWVVDEITFTHCVVKHMLVTFRCREAASGSLARILTNHNLFRKLSLWHLAYGQSFVQIYLLVYGISSDSKHTQNSLNC